MAEKQDVPTVTREEIAGALFELGLAPGDCVIVHASLKSFGHVRGGAEAVVDAVLDVVGPRGTAVFPTFTGGAPEDLAKPVEGRIFTGAVPRAARRRADFLKGRHPFYSICAKGPQARELVELCDRYIFSAGEYKFLDLMSRRGGKALLLGVGQNSNSSVHLVEEFGNLEYKVQDKPCWSLTVEEYLAMPLEEQHRLRRLNLGENLDYDTVYHFEALDDALKRARAIRFGKIGNAELRLMKIADVVRVGLDEVRRDPWFLRSKVQKSR